MSDGVKHFSFPWEYQFPPFFTIQKHQDILSIQLDTWRMFVLDYCEHHKIQELHLSDWLRKPPFYNPEIERWLNLEGMQRVIDSMVERKCAEWIGEGRQSCLIHTKSPKQWADSILSYVKENSLYNTIQTFYEMIEGDSTKDCDFHNIDQRIFRQALRVLEDEGKAAVMEIDGNYGVKFV